MSSIASGDAGRRLKAILRERAFIYRRDDPRISPEWLYYGPTINLSGDLSLVGAAFLEQLRRRFHAKQIATFGLSAIPIVAACVLLSDGEYTGLTIREKAKAYGSRRQIDGPADRSRPVVFVDESITAGSSAYKGIAALEADGFEVEGVLCMVEFPDNFAREWLTARGYRFHAMYDVYADLGRSRYVAESAPRTSSGEDAELRDVDHRRAALRLVSAVGNRSGEALPNTALYDSVIGQYWHAFRNGRFPQYDRPRVQVQPVVRAAEAGASWPSYGSPAGTDGDWDAAGEAAAVAVERVLEAILFDEPVPAITCPAPPAPLYSVGVSLYVDGALFGCWLSHSGSLADCVLAATTNAWADPRYHDVERPARLDHLSFVVSLVHTRQMIGQASPSDVATSFCAGRHSLALASNAGSTGLILAYFASHESWSRETVVANVSRKAGSADGTWASYETASFLRRGRTTTRLAFGLPAERTAPRTGHELAAQIAAFIVRQPDPNTGLPPYLVEIGSGRARFSGTATRVLAAVCAVVEFAGTGAPYSTAAEELTDAVCRYIADPLNLRAEAELSWNRSADSGLVALAALTRDRRLFDAASCAVDRLVASLKPDGAVHDGTRMVCDVDYLSGSIIGSLSSFADAFGVDVFGDWSLERSLAFYRRRFTLVHPYAMQWWHVFAWSKLADRVAGARDFVYELADWSVRNQSADGAYLTDINKEMPGFDSACVLEGVALAWRLAEAAGDDRALVYRDSHARALSLIDRLVVRPDEAFFSRRPDLVRGGVRESLHRCRLRIDYAAHALSALSNGLTAATTRQAETRPIRDRVSAPS